jgi:thiamine-phosphate pyrophosphorylase
MLIVITDYIYRPNEALIWQQLLHAGADCIHIRKPGMEEDTLRMLINAVDKEYRSKLVLHYNYALAQEMELGGCHLSYVDFKQAINNASQGSKLLPLSVSVHNWDECRDIINHAAYCFISPVFDSISKSSYYANVTLSVVPTDLSGEKIIALGGVNAGNAPKAMQNGFYGVAALGYIWQDESQIFNNTASLKAALIRS